MEITGTLRNLDVAEPSSMGSLFGNTTFNFVIITAEDFTLPTGTTKFVPVRMDCFVRMVNPVGFRVRVRGNFDDFDSILRATHLDILDCHVQIRAAKRVNPILAVILSIALVIAAYMGYALLFRMFSAAIINESSTWLAIDCLFLVAYAIMAFVALRIFGKLLIPSIDEGIDRWIRRFTEYKRTP